MSIEIPERITSDPTICGGRPIIRGMRVRVTDVLEMLSNGMTHAEIVENFPYIELEDIQACLKFAAQMLDHSVVIASK